MNDHVRVLQDVHIRSPPVWSGLRAAYSHFSRAVSICCLIYWMEDGAMTDTDRLTVIQNHLWTLELLTEDLVQRDLEQECEEQKPGAFRSMAGIHQAIRTIAKLASEQMERAVALREQDR